MFAARCTEGASRYNIYISLSLSLYIYIYIRHRAFRHAMACVFPSEGSSLLEFSNFLLCQILWQSRERDEISLSRGCLPDDLGIPPFWYGICITGMEFILLDSLLMGLHARISYQKQPNVEKHTPARASPSWPPAKRFGMELVSLVWGSCSWIHYLLHFVYQFHTKPDYFGPGHPF